jgi:cell division protein FtsQ
VFGLVGLFRSPLLDVDKVEVRGAKHTTIRSVLAATGLSTRGHPMIAVDRFALAGKVERLPWVERATIERKWPGTIRIRISERVAIGAIGVPGGVAMLDSSGRVLGTVREQPHGTVAIVAPDRVPGPGATVGPALRGALAVLRALSDPLADKTESVHRVTGSPPAYDVVLAGGVTVRFGDATELAEKVTAAEAVYTVEHAPGTVIDVRVPRSPAVTHSLIPTKS